MLTVFGFLVAWHALADYPLQGDWLAKAKNPTLDLVSGETIWPLALASHAAIHAAGVGYITGSGWAALFEFIVHGLTDLAKCRGRIGYNTDQVIHIATKALIVVVMVGGFR